MMQIAIEIRIGIRKSVRIVSPSPIRLIQANVRNMVLNVMIEFSWVGE